MFAMSPNPVRKSVRKGVLAAALALTGTAALGQQVANLDDERRAYLSAQCDHIRDHAEASGCYAKSSIEFNRAKTAAAKQTLDVANKGIADAAVLKTCLTYLQQQRASGKAFDRTITRDNACTYARELGMRDGPG